MPKHPHKVVLVSVLRQCMQLHVLTFRGTAAPTKRRVSCRPLCVFVHLPHDMLADTEGSPWSLQVRLQLNDCQVDALKALHICLTDQLLNVTAERFHISNLLQV